jgi:hypothetical protein
MKPLRPTEPAPEDCTALPAAREAVQAVLAKPDHVDRLATLLLAAVRVRIKASEAKGLPGELAAALADLDRALTPR